MTPTSLEGQTLGKYRVLEPLGAGGMARVYRAYHPQLDRYVAIKVLRSDLTEDEEFLARFQREARAVANLRHPHIVQVYDFEVENVFYYMVLELLEGDTLKVRLADYRARGERMPWGETARIMLDVLDGLAYAHSEGMIHRDIKPANILLSRRGQAVLADFGIAQIVGGTRHTASGMMMGTLNYMAPEQGLEGRSDARSDIYSLGIVFYEIMTQRTPFEADTPLAILMKHLNDPLPLPRQIDPAIPAPFERVVLKSLAKNADDRYQTAEEMARALHQAVQEANIDLPGRVSLPLSFTTTAAPAEPVAVFSGTARERLSEADFAADDTDANLSQRLAAERAAAVPPPAAPAVPVGPQSPEELGKELFSAVGTLGKVVIGQVAQSLREAAKTAETSSAQAIREAAESAKKKASVASWSTEPEADEADVEEDLPPATGLGASLEEQMAAYRARYANIDDKVPLSPPAPPSSPVPPPPIGAEAEHAARKMEYAARKMERFAHKLEERAAYKRERAARQVEAEYSEPCETTTTCGGVARSIFSAIGLVTVVNLVLLWIAGTTDKWAIYEIGWPIQLFLVSMGLCMIMMAAGASGMLIPVGLIFGNGIILSYYSITGNWEGWATLWPLEPLLVIGVVWLTVSVAGLGKFSCRFSRLMGCALWLLAAAMSWVVFVTVFALPPVVMPH
jgi:serine/threonine protein kinase